MKAIDIKKLLLAILIFVPLPFLGFYLGTLYSQNQPQKVQTNQEKNDKNTTTINPNRNRSCGKPTILLSQLKVSIQEAEDYLRRNNLRIVEGGGEGYSDEIIVEVGVGKDTFWINKLTADGIGVANYDTIGCDFVNY